MKYKISLNFRNHGLQNYYSYTSELWQKLIIKFTSHAAFMISFTNSNNKCSNPQLILNNLKH